MKRCMQRNLNSLNRRHLIAHETTLHLTRSRTGSTLPPLSGEKKIIGTRGCRPEEEEGLAITGCQAYWQSIRAWKDRRAKQLVACRQ
ncbi:hypothetical protein TNCT_630591 [Trichonephila clavata]|uniref:Uncharacterized protein n=1 Tax=Trichonephila clavata TaxID=2740835 RepID=A0A8X6M3M3_TRICU|nr:hypothetical protein TNCT_630591 [Trichonephila clavata]